MGSSCDVYPIIKKESLDGEIMRSGHANKFSGLLKLSQKEISEIPFGRCKASFVTRSSKPLQSLFRLVFSSRLKVFLTRFAAYVLRPVDDVCVCACARVYSVVFISL